MSRYSRSIRIEAPAAAVWSTMMQVETWPAWAAQFQRLERLDPRPLGPNTWIRVKPKGMPAALWQVTDYEEGRSFTWASDALPGLRITGGHVVTPDGEATDAQFWLEASGALGRLLGPILNRTLFSRNTQRATQGLKCHMERRSPARES